jgi:hypothetical protein
MNNTSPSSGWSLPLISSIMNPVHSEILGKVHTLVTMQERAYVTYQEQHLPVGESFCQAWVMPFISCLKTVHWDCP